MGISDPSHLLLDFFGTIVDYSPSRTEQGYHRSHALVRQYGSPASYDEFLAVTDQAFGEIDDHHARTLDEFSMHDAASVILERLLPRPAQPAEIDGFVGSYLADWDQGVSHPAGMAELLAQLSKRYRLAVVSNTHHPALVPDHLAAMGVRQLFDAIVLSVEVGHRKPHPEIYRAALGRHGIGPEQALFVGDTFAADYAGPREQGIKALLIDPDRTAELPAEDRLVSLFDLGARQG